jgi:hypothetical protein
MSKIFAMLVMGMSIAVAVGTAFAGEPGKDSVDHQTFPTLAVTRGEATNTGTIAGPSQPSSVWIEMRADNREH